MEWCKDNDIDIEHEHVPEVPAEFCNISMKKIPYPLPMTIKQQHNDHECGSWQFPTELVPKHQKGCVLMEAGGNQEIQSQKVG